MLLREKKNLVLPPPNQRPSLASRVDDHAANYLTSSGPLTKQSLPERQDGRETQRRKTLVKTAGRRGRARAHHSPIDGAKPSLFALIIA